MKLQLVEEVMQLGMERRVDYCHVRLLLVLDLDQDHSSATKLQHQEELL